MKNIFFLFVFTILNISMTYGQCAGLPTLLPLTQQGIEDANLIIAERFAPTIRHMTETKNENSSYGRADLITSVFYDGNFDTRDNWESLGNYDPWDGDTQDLDALDPVVYYSVVWLESHWILTYAFYHPRDYSDMGSCCTDNHENDLEGAIFRISRNGTCNVQRIGTIFHNELLETSGSNTNIFIDNGGHAVKAGLSLDDCIESDGLQSWYACDNCRDFENPHIVYTYNSALPPGVTAAPSAIKETYLVGTGNYKLEDIFSTSPNSLSSQRSNPNVFVGPDQNRFARQAPNPSNTDCQDQGWASAPWGWSQFDYSYSHMSNFVNSSNIVVINNPYSLCNAGVANVDMVISTNTLWDQGLYSPYANITVNSGVTFTIKNSIIPFINGAGKIFLEKGAKLIVDNSVLTSCSNWTAPNTKWQGIFMEEGDPQLNPTSQLDFNKAPVCIIKNNSKLEFMSQGVTNTPGFLYPCQNVCNFGGTIIAEDSEFYSNNRSILIEGNKTPNSIIKNCHFDQFGYRHCAHLQGYGYSGTLCELVNNTTVHIIDSEEPIIIEDCKFSNLKYGIRILNSNGAKIKNCEFNNMKVGVSLKDVSEIKIKKSKFKDLEITAIDCVDGSFSAYDDCTFDNAGQNQAITLRSTVGITSQAIIGHMDFTRNLFRNNLVAIRSVGQEGPHGLQVINNLFMDNYASLAVNYANDFDFINNSVNDSKYGTELINTGGNFNTIGCNEFVENEIDNLIFFNNAETEFLGNDHISNQGYQNILAGARVKDKVGTIGNPAGNCFDQNNPKLTVGDFWGVPAQPFEYYYSTIESCQEPEDPMGAPHTIVQSISESQNCQDGVGIFNLIDPNGDNNFGVDPINPDFSNVCKPCIQAQINFWITEVVNAGGDNPYTTLEDGYGNNPTVSIKNQTLDQWIQYGLYVALHDKDYLFAEQILNPLLKWRWQKRLYGIKLMSGDLPGALAFINGWITLDSDLLNYREIQQINIKRLETTLDFSALYPQLDGTIVETLTWMDFYPTISQIEIDRLREIGLSNVTSAAFARSLLYVITGEELPMPEFDIADLEIPIDNRYSDEGKEIKVFPNPAKDILFVEGLDDSTAHKLTIYTLTGVRVMEKSLSGKVIEFDVSNLEPGIYLLKLKNEKQEKLIKKIVLL